MKMKEILKNYYYVRKFRKKLSDPSIRLVRVFKTGEFNMGRHGETPVSTVFHYDLIPILQTGDILTITLERPEETT